MSDAPLEVVGAVIVRKGFVLCALRSLDSSLPNVWEFPGGKVEPGESHEHALAREIEEELGCVVTVGTLITSTMHAYGARTVLLHTYQCEISAGEPVAHEHAELRWVTLAQLDALDWAAADIPTVESLARRSFPR